MGPVWLTTHKDLLNSVYATWTLRIGPMALGDENGLWCYNFVFEDIACGLFIGLKKHVDDGDDDVGGDDDAT